jgi:uncharacterized protein
VSKTGQLVIDAHTHAFPDELASRAVPRLAAEGGLEPALDGTVADLLASMDSAGIAASVVASVATKPEQFDPIIRWSGSISSDRLFPFPSVHPDDPHALRRLDFVARAGFRGVKLHPYYQEFVLDEERMLPLYRRIRDLGLVLLCHTGYDIAFGRKRIADPLRIARVLDLVPGLELIAPHLGAWDDWDEAERILAGRPLTLDLAFVSGFLEPARIRRFLLRHPANRAVFGTDSPWVDQSAALEAVRDLDLPEDRLEAILWTNAARLLALNPEAPGRR